VAGPREGKYGTLEPLGGGDPIPLLKERLVIGRRETSDICLRFSNISTSHCELVLEQGYWKVKDLQSTNGVKVNGERVFEKRVYPGDELTIAKHRFRLDYTPVNARSADAEVDELHEDIMRFSLLERAGLTKQGEVSKTAARRRVSGPDDDQALDYLNAPAAGPSTSSADLAKIAASPGSAGLGDENTMDDVTPASSADNLSDDDFLGMINEGGKKKPKDGGKPKP